MRPAPLGIALVALASLPLYAGLPAAHADGTIRYDNTDFGPDTSADTTSADTTDASYPYEGQSGFVVDGLIRRVDAGNDRIVVFGDDNRRYNVDDYNADIRLHGQNADPGDLERGMRVRVSGRLLGVAFVAADLVRVLPSGDADSDTAPLTAITPASPLAPVTPVLPEVDVPAAVPAPLDEGPAGPPVPAQPAVDGKPVDMDAVVTDLDADGRHITVLDPTDAHLTADTLGTDIILPGTTRAGQFADLARGMHVRLIGTQAADGSVQADRIRVTPDPAPAPVAAVVADPNPAPSVAVDVDLSQYTGILIDARGLPGVMRSPAPTIVGADGGLLYPDRAHVPTPDEVQDESVVRYYHTLDDAEQGVAGPHPLILTAAAVVGPASDGLQLADGDAGLLQALDKRLRFSRTWKVGFLIPADR
jgi:hypothetical protein